tara:strand:+ start:135 stop:344 length:210 start_codon:yes stop_codon:yes gene_type:complete
MKPASMNVRHVPCTRTETAWLNASRARLGGSLQKQAEMFAILAHWGNMALVMVIVALFVQQGHTHCQQQ